MSTAIDELRAAQALATKIRPKVGGFPYFAEALRYAGVTRNEWTLPSCQSVYLTARGPIITLGTPLASGMLEVAPFDRSALIHALREDQAGRSSFPEFLGAAWRAGVVRYVVDFEARNVSYFGANGEQYVEEYPAVELPGTEATMPA